MKELQQTIINIVYKAVGKKFAPEMVKSDMRLTELGITSMTLISILFEMESLLGIEVADAVDYIESLDSIGGLIEFAERKAVLKLDQ